MIRIKMAKKTIQALLAALLLVTAANAKPLEVRVQQMIDDSIARAAPPKNEYVINIPPPTEVPDVGKYIQDKLLELFPNKSVGEEATDDFWGVLFVAQPGNYTLSSSIVLDQSKAGAHIVIRGSGFISTTFRIPINLGIVGINAWNSREFTLENIRVVEAVGTRTSCCVLMGGTSCTIRNCWTGGAHIGFLVDGSDGLMDNCFAEHCNSNLSITTRYFNSKWGLPPLTDNARYNTISGFRSYMGTIELVNYLQLKVEVETGTLLPLDELTVEGSAVPAKILDIYKANDTTTLLVTRSSYSHLLKGPFTTSGGATGRVIDYYGNLLRNNILSDVQMIHTSPWTKPGPAILIDCADDTQMDVMATGCRNTIIRGSRNIRYSGNHRDTESGLVIENSTGILTGFMDNKHEVTIDAASCFTIGTVRTPSTP